MASSATAPVSESERIHNNTFTLRRISSKRFKRGNITNHVYRLRINDENLRDSNIVDVIEGWKKMFAAVLHSLLRGLPPHTKMVIGIDADRLHSMIIVPLRRIDEVSPETIVAVIDKICSSAYPGLTGASLTRIEIGLFVPPSGSGGANIFDLGCGYNDSRRKKRSIITIRNRDHLCMARAVYVANEKFIKGSNIKNLIRSTVNKKLTKQALTLHKKLGLPLDEACCIADIARFEDLLKVRICVVSSLISNKFIYDGNDAYSDNGVLYLYHVHEPVGDRSHFDVISNIKGFLGTTYFCPKCNNGFDKSFSHKCKKFCNSCHRASCCAGDSMLSCIKCNLTFNSPECFDKHKEIRETIRGKNAPSWCDKRWRCTNCMKFFNLSRSFQIADHVCYQKKCKFCNTFQDQSHICYHRSYDPTGPKKKFIFLDYECDVTVRATDCKNGYARKHDQDCVDCKAIGDICEFCRLCTNCKERSCGQLMHVPNYCVVQRCCEQCYDKSVNEGCSYCPLRCKKCDKRDKKGVYTLPPCSDYCKLREVVFSSNNVTNEVGRYIFRKENKGCVVMAHNLGRYDATFLMDYVVRNSMIPDPVIYRGTRCVFWMIRQLSLKFVDSVNFLPMKLDEMPSCLGVEVESKKFFPIFFNTAQNRGYIGSFPEKHYFNTDSMDLCKLNEFEIWYKEHEGDFFDLESTLYEYCSHDVNILRLCVQRFRELVIDLTCSEMISESGDIIKIPGMDPFANAVTLPQMCQKIYRYLCLSETHKVLMNGSSEPILAERCMGHFIHPSGSMMGCVIPPASICNSEFVKTKISQLDPNGNITNKLFSKISIQCMLYLQQKLRITKGQDNITIQHALSDGGEKVIRLSDGKEASVDGWYILNDVEHVIEFHGCFYHSCIRCYPSQRSKIIHPFYGVSLDENYDKTVSRDILIRNSGYGLSVVWECDFRRLLENDVFLTKYVSQFDLVERIHPRDALYGGRCEAFRLHCDVQNLCKGSTIEYFDFVSLYPSVQFSKKKFPVGQYRVISSDFTNIGDYCGIAKVRVIPPSDLFIPLLPYRSNGKLVFPLCAKCSDDLYQGLCICSEKERSWIGTYATPELEKAVRVGYKIEKIYEIYHYDATEVYDPQDENSSKGLFTEYIKIFMREKTHASGWPDLCITDALKASFINDYKDMYGIVLDPNKIEFNKGRRSVAKYCLNTLWGVYCQKANPQVTSMVGEAGFKKFVQLMSSATKSVSNFHIVSDDMMQVEWTYNTDYTPPQNNRNVILGLFVTCYARLKLFDELHHLGRNVLYTDTDSIIYMNKKGENTKISSSFLGELSSELPSDVYIEEFVSSGSKTYAYRTSANNTVVKAKGFVLDHRLRSKVNLESMLRLVDTAMSDAHLKPFSGNESEHVRKIKVKRRKIIKDKYAQRMYTADEFKTYSFVFTKRILCEDYSTLPFGYR